MWDIIVILVMGFIWVRPGFFTFLFMFYCLKSNSKCGKRYWAGNRLFDLFYLQNMYKWAIFRFSAGFFCIYIEEARMDLLSAKYGRKCAWRDRYTPPQFHTLEGMTVWKFLTRNGMPLKIPWAINKKKTMNRSRIVFFTCNIPVYWELKNNIKMVAMHVGAKSLMKDIIILLKSID
jgi:hypothetical protein